ncbi:hypothetical protein EVJ30_04695 [Exiguobacterium sp. SH5S13]|uniref:hypothetical protein n=1 Tax=Exiguobacterium sp. SH5S13 TaxID=2510959 RepID=UPI00103A0E4A|nr:hypothetical protein [Exiguobacterium sp. SH5S13]TCI56190.1 hypothetical protein EVJ30_04695 [Exiguobacterium sp. SH5S13]
MTKQERIQAIGAYREPHQKIVFWLTAALIFLNSFTLSFDDFWWVWGIGSIFAAIGLVRFMLREGEVLMAFTNGRGRVLTKRLYQMYSLWIVWVTGTILLSRLHIPTFGWVLYGVCFMILGWRHYTTHKQFKQADTDQPTRDEITKDYRSYERSTYADKTRTH